jgi:hypothetical protein
MTDPHTRRREIRLRTTVLLDHPAPEVARVLLDWGNDHRWRRHVRSFACVPAGRAVAGQVLTERLALGGLTFTTTTEVVRADALSAAYTGASASVRVRGTRTLTPLDAGACRFTSETVVEPLGALRLLAPVLTGTYRRADEADVRRLPDVLARLLTETTTHEEITA